MKTLFLSLAFVLSLTAFSQTTIKGFVIDETNRPVIGAQVMESGSRNGTTTNIDGSFLIELDDSTSLLTFSFQGYASDTLALDSEKLNQVVLKESKVSSPSSVIFGYLMDYRVWSLVIWAIICTWLVLRTFRGVPSA